MQEKLCSCVPRRLALALFLGVACWKGLPASAQSLFPPPRAPRPWQIPAALPAGKDGGADAAAVWNLPDSAQTGSPLTTVTASFAGIPTDFTLEPPDPSGAAGPNGVLQTVNLRIAYSDKSGNDIWGPISDASFWASAGMNPNNLLSDPHTLFDPVTGHFYTVLLEVDDAASKSYLNVAVSKTANPATSGTADWYFYRIDDTETIGTNSYWTDYPGLGIDSQAVYVTYNMYSFPLASASSGNAVIIVLDKAAINSGTPTAHFVYNNGFTLQPCTVQGANSPGNVAYFGETLFFDSTHIRVWALSDPLGARTLTSTLVTVPDNGGPPPFTGAPQPGTPITVDTLDGRTEGNAFWYNGSIWFCHTAGGSTGKSLVYYYNINLNGYPNGVPSLGEEGFIDGGAGEWTYQPNIGANALGDVAIVFSQSSASRNPSIFAASRKAGVPAFDTPVLIKTSPSYYYGGRWGDFGSTTADPVNNSFWVTHEWSRSTQLGDWGTWWANISPILAPYLTITTNSILGGNGNGVIDPNECNQLYLVLTNTGSLGATNLRATLTSTTPGVLVTARASLYPDLPVGVAGTNLTAFQISTAPSLICGTPISLVLTLKSDQGSQTNAFALNSGGLGVPLRYDNPTAYPIPDATPTGADSPVVVSNFNSAVLKATVGLYITHTYDSDLLLELVSPDGITNVLAANVGGGGQNFGSACSDGSETVFDDAAGVGIASGAAPFLGAFKPAQPLSVFIGKTGTNVNGTWHLHVVDQVPFDSGIIQCWSLLLTPSVCVDGGGQCPGNDLAIAGAVSPDPVIVGNNLVYHLGITNLGPSNAKGVVLSQSLPASLVFVSATISQGNITYAGGTVSGNIGSLPVGGVVTATVTVLPTQSGAFTSTANVSAASGPDPDLSNNTISLLRHVNPPTADLAVGLLATPNAALVGGMLTYTVSVTNNGPSTASGVVVTNALDPNLALTSVSVSQGSYSIQGNAVVLNLGTLASGSIATATITAVPGIQGAVTTTASVSANQLDPLPANNTASVTTTVGPAADLAVGFATLPPSVVVGGPLTYVVSATNFGPNTATSVMLNLSLPPDAVVVSTNVSQGSISYDGIGTVACNVGSLPLGGTVTLTVGVILIDLGTNTATAVVAGAETDPNLANNTASASTLVAPPFVSIVGAGAAITAESFSPPDGAIEPGETVTVRFSLVNQGNIPAPANVLASLLASGGVTAPAPVGSTNLGTLTPGFPAPVSFSFTAQGTNGGTITATLKLSGGATNLVAFNFTLPQVTSAANTNLIHITDNEAPPWPAGPGLPYPSSLTISGVTGLVGKVTATVSNLSHTYPHDISILLVGPTGAQTLLMSHISDMSFLTGATLTFDDAAAAPLPATGSFGTGVWQPAAYAPAPVFTNPAPAGPYSSAMSTFNALNPNGTWSLYVIDDSDGDYGNIANGWSLAITTIAPVNQVADLALSGTAAPNPVLVNNTLTYTFTVTNRGPNTANAVLLTNVLPANINYLAASSSQGGVTRYGSTLVGSLGSLAAGSSASVTVQVTPTLAAVGSLTNTASVVANETDFVPANNAATVITAVNLPVADVALTKLAPTNVVAGSNFIYTLTVTNQGPGPAYNVFVTDPLPPGVIFSSASVSYHLGNAVGVAGIQVANTGGTNASGVYTNSLGTLALNTGVVITLNVHGTVLGPGTNVASVTTLSIDPNLTNNVSSAVTLVRAPAPNVLAAGARLLTESFSPPNGAIDPGETVSVSLTLTNTGEINTTTNFTATLLNTGGVMASSGSQTYGALVHNGADVARTFTFTASAARSSLLTATLQLQDGANNLGTAVFTFNVSQSAGFTNTTAIVIPDHGVAAPYPSAINVSGLNGVISKATVTLTGLTHTFPHDIGVLLVSPSGAKAVLMADVGGAYSVSNLNLTFDDASAASLSAAAPMVSGTFKPTYLPPGKVFLTPAPTGPFASALAAFNATSPNGAWLLYVVDDSPGDSGIIAGGWSLNLTTVSPVNPLTDLSVTGSGSASTVYAGTGLTYTLNVTNNGPASATGVTLTDTLPAGALLVSVNSPGGYSTNGNTVTCSLGGLSAGAGTSVTLGIRPFTTGVILDTATVTGNETDLLPANNATQISTTVLTTAPARLSATAYRTNQFQLKLTGQATLTYVLQSATNLTAGIWTPIATNLLPGNGVMTFTDTNAVHFHQRFYRAVLVP